MKVTIFVAALILLPPILNNAFKNIAQLNGKTAKVILNAFQLSKIVKRNVEVKHLVGLFASAKQETITQLLSQNALMLITALDQNQHLQQQLPQLILKNALKSIAPINGPNAKKTPNAFQPSKNAKRNAELVQHVGLSASARLETVPLLILLNALMLITALDQKQKFQQLSPQLILKNVFKNIAPINGPNAKKILNVFQLFKNAKRNAELVQHAGLSASAKPEIVLLLILQNALMLITALDNSQKLLLPSLTLPHALEKNAQIKLLDAKKTLNVSQPFKPVKENAITQQLKPASHNVLLAKAANLLSASIPVDRKMTASKEIQQKQHRLQLLSLILNNAFNKNVQINGQPAKKTPNAFQLFKIVKRNAELAQAAGHSVSQEKEVQPLLMLQNVLKRTIAYD